MNKLPKDNKGDLLDGNGKNSKSQNDEEISNIQNKLRQQQLEKEKNFQEKLAKLKEEEENRVNAEMAKFEVEIEETENNLKEEAKEKLAKLNKDNQIFMSKQEQKLESDIEATKQKMKSENATDIDIDNEVDKLMTNHNKNLLKFSNNLQLNREKIQNQLNNRIKNRRNWSNITIIRVNFLCFIIELKPLVNYFSQI
jgi:hypothetical protein